MYSIIVNSLSKHRKDLRVVYSNTDAHMRETNLNLANKNQHPTTRLLESDLDWLRWRRGRDVTVLIPHFHIHVVRPVFQFIVRLVVLQARVVITTMIRRQR